MPLPRRSTAAFAVALALAGGAPATAAGDRRGCTDLGNTECWVCTTVLDFRNQFGGEWGPVWIAEDGDIWIDDPVGPFWDCPPYDWGG